MDSAHVVEGFRVKLNFLYCSVYFLAGGLIYLYREVIMKWMAKLRYVVMILCFVVWFGYYFVRLPEVTYGIWHLLLFSLMLMYAIGTQGKILNNKMTHFLSDISMEIYLCHFGVLRVADKLGIRYIFGKGIWSYLVTTLFVFIGAVIFSVCAKRVLKAVDKKLHTTKK